MKDYKPAIFIYFDGSFKKFEDGTTKSSIGFYIETQGGEKLDEHKCIIKDIESNTEAEYKSLELALKRVLNKYSSNNRLFVFGDEKTIIENLNNNPRKKCKYNDILNSITAIKNKFQYVTFTHISQSENRKAHKLSNSAINN